MLARAIALAMRLMFDGAAAGDLDATLGMRVRLLGGRRSLPLVVRVTEGTCSVRPGSSPDAKAQVTIGFRDMALLGLRLEGWPALLSSGRIEFAGDPFLALRFPAMFRLPAVGSRLTAHAPT